MATVNVSELVERAAIAADMHDNFVDNPAWLYWANIEYKQLLVRLVRSGFPWNITNVAIVTDGTQTFSISEPLAVLGVYEQLTDGTQRRVKYKSHVNKIGVSQTTGAADEFTLNYSPTTNELLVTFYPAPPSGTNYSVHTIPYPSKLVLSSPGAGETTSINLPLNWDERIVLGMARRALAREETSSSTLESLIRDIDNHIDNAVYDYLLVQNNTVHSVEDVSDTNTGFIFWY